MPEKDEQVFVRIGNREIYDAVTKLERTVLSMDDRMNSILNENVVLSRRVRSLELKVYTILAGLTSVLVAGAFAIVKGIGG
jgi:hypothetical protein